MARKKFVYLFESGELSKTDNKFNFHSSDIYSSQEKVNHRVYNSLKVNKGYDSIVEEFDEPTFNGGVFTLVTYKCKDVEGITEMTIRYRITKKEVL